MFTNISLLEFDMSETFIPIKNINETENELMNEAFCACNTKYNIQPTDIRFMSADESLYCIGIPININNKEKYLSKIDTLAGLISSGIFKIKTHLESILNVTGLLNNSTIQTNFCFNSQKTFNISDLSNNYIENCKNIRPFNVDLKFDIMNYTPTVNYYVFINTHICTSFVSTNHNFIKLFEKYPEYGFIFIYYCSTTLKDYLFTAFNAKTFCSINDLENTLNTTANYINWTNEQPKQNFIMNAQIEKKLINDFIKQKFIITTNKEDTILCNNIYRLFQFENREDIYYTDEFKYRFAKYLNEIGIEKMRLNDDAYYFCGIKNI